MTPTTGNSIWSVRPEPQGEEWRHYTLGPKLGPAKSGFADVYRIADDTTPKLVAKIYHGQGYIRQLLTADAEYALRLYSLAFHGSELSRRLPFATFPRRLIYPRKTAHSTQQGPDLLGFTMLERRSHHALLGILMGDVAAQRLTHPQVIHIAEHMAHALSRVHADPLRIAIGDVSPNNILISPTFSEIALIDLDGIGFHCPRLNQTFKSSPGYTNGYVARRFLANRSQGATAADDDVVLAVLIFQLLMVSCGIVPAPHPFAFLTDEVDHLAAVYPDFLLVHKTMAELYKNRPDSAPSLEDITHFAGAFPYVDGLREKVLHPSLVTAYASWSHELRSTFEGVFTGKKTVSAADWARLLAKYRRSLRCA